jgi:hypothetical protein
MPKKVHTYYCKISLNQARHFIIISKGKKKKISNDLKLFSTHLFAKDCKF